MKDNHLIQKVLVEVDTNSSSRANELQRDASDFIKNRILPIVEKILDEKTKNWPVNESVLIEQLELNIDSFDSEWGEIQLERKIEHEVERLIDVVIRKTVSISGKEVDDLHVDTAAVSESRKNEGKRAEPKEKQVKGWLYFLKTGMRPWWAVDAKRFNAVIQEESILALLQEVPTEIKTAVRQVSTHHQSLKRLIAQYSNEFLVQFFLRGLPQVSFSKQEESGFQRALEKLFKAADKQEHKKVNRLSFWTALFTQILMLKFEGKQIKKADFIAFCAAIRPPMNSDKVRLDFFELAYETIGFVQKTAHGEKKDFQVEYDRTVTKSNPELQSKPEELAREQSTEKEIKTEKNVQFFVENAGLVLLHPFLNPFFQKIGLLDDGKQINDVPLAVHVLHYLATGEEAGFEHNMLLEKFLVNHPLHVPVERNIQLSGNIKTEAADLLNSVIVHWSKLKGSSIEALQETFLQRSGKLIDEYPQPRLIVERKTVDILMKDLSWSISIMKLPWLEKLIFVEW